MTALQDRYAGIFTRSSLAAAANGVGGARSNSLDLDGISNDNLSSLTSSGAGSGMIVSPGFETTTLLQSIHPVPLDEIGSDKFMAAYCVNLERLSIQAHLTAGVIAGAQVDSVGIGGGGVSIGSDGQKTMATPGLGDVLSSLTGGNDEEYVVEAFLEDVEKLEALVRTLLALEFWRENVLFGRRRNNAINAAVEEEEEEVEFEVEGGERGEDDDYDELNDVDGGDEADNCAEAKGLALHLAANGNALRAAFVLHAETTIVSLLGLIFYKGIPAGLLEGNGDDVLLSLVDYCARQLIFLGSPGESNPALSRQKNPLPASQLSSYLQSRSRIDEIRDSAYDSAYQTAVASVALSRYLCESANEMGPSLLSRMLEVHDFPLLMVPLIEEPPWTRRRLVEKRGKRGKDIVVSSNMVWEKLDENNEWREVPSNELLRLTKLEGQPWLALFHLTASKACREAYGLDDYRKSQLMRLRRYLHETLTDQLPVLGDVARYLDELSILGVPPSGRGTHRPSSNASSSGLLLQRVDSLRESIVGRESVRSGEYLESIVRRQWDEVFSRVTDSQDAELRRIANEVYGGAGVDDAALNEGQIDKPQSTTEDWKVALSRPIERVLLQMKDGNDNRLSNAVSDLADRIKNGETMYIHCGGGVGRAGLLCACLLGALYPDIDADTAMEYTTQLCYLRCLDGKTDGVHYSSPETEEQKGQVREYFERIRAP